MPFNTEADFVPVSLIGNVPELLIAHPSAPFDTVEGMVKYARANPGKLSYSSAGVGTLPHITMELLLAPGRRAGHPPRLQGRSACADRSPGWRGAAQVRHVRDDSHRCCPRARSRCSRPPGERASPQLPNVRRSPSPDSPATRATCGSGARAARHSAGGRFRSFVVLAKAARSPKVAARFQADGIETPAGGPEELGRLIRASSPLGARGARREDHGLGLKLSIVHDASRASQRTCRLLRDTDESRRTSSRRARSPACSDHGPAHGEGLPARSRGHPVMAVRPSRRRSTADTQLSQDQLANGALGTWLLRRPT
jgi:hypothetical protein